MRLVRGASGTGKTALVFREFKQAFAQGESARIVVPTATLVRHFQHELARDGFVFSPSAVVSLGRLMGVSRNPLVLRSAVREELARGKYPEFAAVSETAGLLSTIVETIDLFLNAGATANRLLAIRKIGPIGQAFARLWKAVELKISARTPEVPIGKVWMDGFLAFSPIEWEMVSAMAKTCDLTLTLPDLPEFNDIRRNAMALGAKDEPVYGTPRRAARTVFETPTVERETDEIARRILALHAQGTAFRDIGVAMRDTDTYLPLLRSAFERLNIPARFYFAESLTQHPAATFLNGIVENTLSGWDFAQTLKTLRAHPAWGTQTWFDRFDFDLREAIPGRGADAILNICDEDHRKKIAECLSAAHWANEIVRVKDWARRLIHMAQSLYRPGRLEPPDSARDIAAARSQAAGLRAWMEAIDSAAECWSDPNEQISLQQFWTVASDAVSTASIPVRDDRRDVVHVMNVFEARQWDVAALFVCGLTNRDFPRKASPNLLFTETELERIVRAGIVVRTAADTAKQEQALMASIEGRASSHLILSCPTHDASGRAVERSVCADGAVASKPCILTSRTPAPTAARSGVISRPDLLQVREISATGLEDMLQCRFKFFGLKVLKMRPRPEHPQERISPRNMGSIIHKAMEEWVLAGRRGSLVSVFDDVFARMSQEQHLPPGYELEVERLRWRAFAARWNDQDRWAVIDSEPERELMAVLPSGVKVKCRIDRLDLLPDNKCIVIDYKSGGVANIKGNTRSETKLQGPMYALAARQERGLETVAMVYSALQTQEFFGWGAVPGATFELEPMPADWIESGRDRAEERIRHFLSGAVHPEPADTSQCKWCDVKHACRVEAREALVMVEGAHGA